MGRRKKNPEAPKGDDFIVLFTALSMILLAFFIMLNSMATIDDARSRAVMSSLIGTFGSMPGFDMQKVVVELDYESPMGKRAGELESTLRSILEGEIEELDIYTEDGQVIVSVGSSLFFERGSAELSPASFRTLDKLAALIMRMNLPVRIEGHADATPARNPRSNWYYSAARSAALYRYFTVGHSVPTSSVSLAAYGNHRPDRNGDYTARVEVIFLVKEAS